MKEDKQFGHKCLTLLLARKKLLEILHSVTKKMRILKGLTNKWHRDCYRDRQKKFDFFDQLLIIKQNFLL